LVGEPDLRAGETRPWPSQPPEIVADKPQVPIALLRLVLSAACADAAEMERIVSARDPDWGDRALPRLK
jgi:hypothetical protein